MSLSRDEIIQELEKHATHHTEGGPAGITSREWATYRGITQSRASEQLTKLVAAGILEFVGFRNTVTIAGGKSKAPVYQIKTVAATVADGASRHSKPKTSR